MYFDSIIGQSFAKKYICSALKKKKLNNAYIFEGIKGIGKMTFALEMSSILTGVTPENSPDVMVISRGEKSHSIKIEQIRKMKSDVYEKPISDYKIYIIEDAHMMTEEAQNAILKTIEEPPSYAIFIFITENLESILPTIKSRCDIVRFLPLSRNDIMRYLKNKYSLDDDRISVYASFSKGSIATAEGLIEDEKFVDMRNIAQECVSVISERKKLDIEFLADEIEKYEQDISILLDMMINYFRDIIIRKENLGTSLLINTDRKIFIDNMSKRFISAQISDIIDIVEDTKIKLKGFCNFKMSIQVMFLNIYEVIK